MSCACQLVIKENDDDDDDDDDDVVCVELCVFFLFYLSYSCLFLICLAVPPYYLVNKD